jgi:hypothetical protein
MSKIKQDERFEAKEKQKYTVSNWSTYNKDLENRVDITFMIIDEVIANWYSDAPLQRGAQEKYSDICIESIMMFKTVFRLAYRPSNCFTQGILKLMKLEHLEVPSFSQVNRSFCAMDILPFDIPKSGSITIAIDSTSVKVYSKGE